MVTSPSGPPHNGDTAIIKSGTVVILDDGLQRNTVDLNAGTLEFVTDTVSAVTTIDAVSAVVPGTSANAAIDIPGTAANAGTIWRRDDDFQRHEHARYHDGADNLGIYTFDNIAVPSGMAPVFASSYGAPTGDWSISVSSVVSTYRQPPWCGVPLYDLDVTKGYSLFIDDVFGPIDWPVRRPPSPRPGPLA